MATTFRDPAERSGFLRLFYRDWRPTRLGRRVNRALAWLSGLSLTPPVLLTLQVKGRRSGRLRTNVLVVARHDGQRNVTPCSASTRCSLRAPGRDALSSLPTFADVTAERQPPALLWTSASRVGTHKPSGGRAFHGDDFGPLRFWLGATSW